MYRSSSVNRIWDRQSSGNNNHYHHRRHRSEDIEELPTYDPYSDVGKKEKAVARFAGSAVHLIPFILLFCVFLLWFFSSSTEIELDGNMVGAKTEGESDVDSDGTGHTPLDLRKMDPWEIGQSKIFKKDTKK